MQILNKSWNYRKEIIVLLIFMSIFSVVLSNYNRLTSLNIQQDDKTHIPHSAIVYETGYVKFDNDLITDTVFIMGQCFVDIINSTVIGSIYCFDFGYLNLTIQSNITENLIFSDNSQGWIKNSTIGGNIECRDQSMIFLRECFTPTTTIWKFDYAFIDVYSSEFNALNEFGITGNIYIDDSTISVITLNGKYTSKTDLTNCTIGVINDDVNPYHQITTTGAFNLIFLSSIIKTSEKSINFSWVGFDSPTINGFMNITFKIFIDRQFYLEINGSGYLDEYSGSRIILFETQETHNITLVSIDGVGNNFTSSIIVDIIDYPTFDWGTFSIGLFAFAGIIVLIILFLRYRQGKGYRDSLSIIFKKELKANRMKTIIFMAIGVAPGVLLYFIFGVMNILLNKVGIDQVRNMISTILNFYLIYFEMFFTIVFSSTSIINHKKDGSLSWFMSKPVRRWEFLWGKTLAYMTIASLVMIPTAFSITISGIAFLDPIYVIDMISIGGFIYLIGIATMIPLVAIGMMFSTIFRKQGLAIFLPIMMLIILPTLVGFLPILVHHEWPLLFSYSYYSEILGSFWISESGQGLNNLLGPFSELLGIKITSFGFTAGHIVLILVLIMIACMVISTYYIRRIDI